MGEILKKITKVAWFIPSLLLWAAFPPMAERADIVFALAPLLWLTRRGEKKQILKVWFINGFMFYFATLAWMPAIVKNGGPWPLVVLGWAGLAAYCAAYFWLYGALMFQVWSWAKSGKYWRRVFAIIIAEPILWCGLEIVRSRFMSGFAWNQLGVAVINGGFGDAAAFGGVYLCSALVILVNGVIASVIERVWRWEDSGAWPMWTRPIETILPVVIVAAICFGAKKDALDRDAVEREIIPLKVALVQRNFPCVFQEREGEPTQVYHRLLENVTPLKPDFVVMSESALCEFGEIGSYSARRFLDGVINLTGARAVLAGGGRFAEKKEYNSAVLHLASGEEMVYDKVHLVPFGEFIPCDKIFPALQSLAPVGSCTAGELKTLDLGDGISLGVAICYEDTDSAQLRQLVEKGASMLVFITNDSWFSYSDEAVQHSWQAVARAIETGLAVVRVGNSGVSGVIFPDGKAKWIARNGEALTDEKATMFEIIPIKKNTSLRPPTAYVRFGDKPIFILFLLLITGMILVKYTITYAKRRAMSL